MKTAKKLTPSDSVRVILQKFFSKNSVVTRTLIEGLALEVEQATKGTVLEITKSEFLDIVYIVLNGSYFETLIGENVWEMRDGGEFIDYVTQDIRRFYFEIPDNDQATEVCQNLHKIMEDKGFLDSSHPKWTKFRYYEPSSLSLPSLETCPA